MTAKSKSNVLHYVWGDGCDGWHLTQTPGLSVIQERVPAGKGETLHVHHLAEQFFFVLSGRASLEIDGQLFELLPQQGMHVAPGVPHRLTNYQQSDLEFLVISTPPSHGDRLEIAD